MKRYKLKSVDIKFQ